MKQKFNVPSMLILACAIITASGNGCSNRNTDIAKAGTSERGPGWKVIGPGGGGGLFDPTIDPADPTHVLMRCDMTAGYVTRDDGQHWDIYNLWTVITDFEFVPDGSGTVYASTRGYLHDEDRGSGLSMLCRSEDGGTNWEIIYPPLSEYKSLKSFHTMQSLSLTPSEMAPGLPDRSIDKICVDPSNPDNIYLGMSPLLPYIGRPAEPTEGTAILMVSNDRGVNWKMAATLKGKKILAIVPYKDGISKGKMIVVTETTCHEYDPADHSLKEYPLPVETAQSAEGGGGLNGMVLYLLARTGYKEGELQGGLFRSLNRGVTWEAVNERVIKALPGEKIFNFQSIGVCENSPEDIYLAGNTIIPGMGKTKTVNHEVMYRSRDAGDTWQTVYLSDTRNVLSANFQGSWLNDTYGPGWGGVPISMGVSPTDPDICYGTDYGRAYCTKDGGKNWHVVYSVKNSDGSYSGTGLDVTCCYGVHFDPFDPDHLAISFIDAALFQSYDAGKTWFHTIEGIPDKWVNTCYWLEFDPAVKDRMWSVWSDLHSLPRRSQFAPDRFTHGTGGVARSDDGGKTWMKSNEGMPENSVATHILVDPQSPEGERILYACVFDRGLYKSVDGGKSWNLVTKALGKHQYAWETRLSGKYLYFLCVRGWPDDSTVVNGAIFVSEDGAETWSELKLPEGVNAPLDLLVDPGDPDRMYVSCWPSTVNGSDEKGGVFRTDDAGKSWKQVFDESCRVYAAALDPRNTKTVFINTFQNAAWRSDDRGDTWKRLGGYTFKWGHRPVPDPYHPGMLYLTTYGGSVYYGPAEGVESKKSDIQNFPDNWW